MRSPPSIAGAASVVRRWTRDASSERRAFRAPRRWPGSPAPTVRAAFDTSGTPAIVGGARCHRRRVDARAAHDLAAAMAIPAPDASQRETSPGPSVLTQVLAGITVSLAMVPESLAFTFVAGVSPIVGLHAAALMGLCTAVLGAQPGVISGAAGATAVVFAPLVASHGPEYLFAAVALAGAIQAVAGALRLGKFIRLVPQPCMIGFVNGLAIVIGSAQINSFAGLADAALYTQVALTALTMALIKLIPNLSFVPKQIPAPLLAIASVGTLVQVAGIATKTVGDVAAVAGSLPAFHIPNVPVEFETWATIFPFAASVAAVGLIETLLTQQLVDDVTERRTSTHKECIAQGAANLVNGFFGAMGGCAMIGQSMINVQAGGRTRVSGLTCAMAIASYVTFGAGFIERVPIAALAGTMLCLVLDIFDWTSFARIRKIPKTDATVLVLVTGVTVVTNLAVAVFSGVVLSALGYAYKSSQRIEARRTSVPIKTDSIEHRTVYEISGPLFFGSVGSFLEQLDPRMEGNDRVVLDFASSKVWDSSALVAIDDVADKFRNCGKVVTLRHLSPDCAALLRKAGDLVEVNLEEDPEYPVAADYDDEELETLTDHAAHGTHVSLEDWERSALQRQYTTPAGFRVLVDKVEEDGPARKSGGRGARLGA